MVRIFNRERLWERGRPGGDLRLREERKPKKEPWRDHNGKLLVANVNYYLLDDKYPPTSKRHIVLHAHCFLAEDGSIGASGKVEPKEMLVGGIEYRQLEFKNPRCALCEDGGDMIPPEERFQSSTYRPPFRNP